MTYTFIFFGEIQPTSDIEKVQRILANKFHIPISEILQLFDENHKFERKGLSKDIARAYQHEFSKAGALSHIIEDTPVNIEHVELPTPNIENKPIKQSHKKNTSSAWLKWASLCIIGLMIGDEYLQSAQVIVRSGLDIGNWPLILAHIPLLIGCSILAREKKWPAWFGILSFLSLAGLSLLLLMPYKGQKNYKLGFGSLCITLFTFSVFAYWVNGFSTTSALEKELLLIADNLHHGRSEYPSATQSSLTDYKQEQEELYNFMNSLITAIENDEFRPDTVNKLGDRMFSEFARYLIWRKYQFFKHTSQDIELPESLRKEFTTQDAALFRSLIDKSTQFHTPRLFEVKNEWLIAVSDDKYGSIESQIGRQMNQVFDAVRDGSINYSRSKEPIKNINVATLNLPILTGAELNRHKNHVEYIFTSGPLKGKNIAIGFYREVHKPKFGKELIYRHKYAVISHEFPAKYFSNLLGVFKGYK